MKQLAHAAPAPIACQRGSPGSLRIETDALSPITVAGYRIRAAESAPDRSHSLGVSAARLQVSRLRLGPRRSPFKAPLVGPLCAGVMGPFWRHRAGSHPPPSRLRAPRRHAPGIRGWPWRSRLPHRSGPEASLAFFVHVCLNCLACSSALSGAQATQKRMNKHAL